MRAKSSRWTDPTGTVAISCDSLPWPNRWEKLVQERHLFGGQVIGPRAPRVRPSYEASARVALHPMPQHFVGPSSPGGVIVGGHALRLGWTSCRRPLGPHPGT